MLESKKKIWVLASLIILVELSLVLIFLFKPAYVEDISHVNSKVPVGELVKETQVEQEIKVSSNNFAAVDIQFATYVRENDSEIIVEIIDAEKYETIYKVKLSAIKLEDNEFKRIEFPKVENSKDKTYIVKVYSPDATNANAITIWSSDSNTYKDGSLRMNHEVLDKDISFKTYYMTQNIDQYNRMIEKLPVNKTFLYVLILGLFLSVNAFIFEIIYYKTRNV